MNQIIRLTGGQAERAADAAARLAVVMPVLDDWHSFAALIGHIACQVGQNASWLEIVAIDDGSQASFDPATLALDANIHVDAIRIVHLALNLGHQRAIAVGLATLASREDLDHVIVMDSDGEDRPEDIPVLLQASRRSPGHVILAHRGKRSEPLMFKAGYWLYKFFFRTLTGRGISFGNFSLLPMAAVRRLVHMSELWNNLPAAIIRSRLRFTPAHTVRGTRRLGQSKMDFAALVIHGLSAMSVYTDLIFVRVLLAVAAVSALSFIAICVVVTLRLGTTLATPGWATTVFGDLIIILLQGMLMIVAASLMVLGGRSARPIVPITDAPVYVQNVSEVVFGRPVRPYGT